MQQLCMLARPHAVKRCHIKPLGALGFIHFSKCGNVIIPHALGFNSFPSANQVFGILRFSLTFLL